MTEETIRISAKPLQDNSYITLRVDQKFKQLNVLSLSLNEESVYSTFNSNHGILVGRVLANGGVGLPNVKISVFISKDPNEKPEIEKYYPYVNTSDKNEVNKKYNLLPKVRRFLRIEEDSLRGMYYNRFGIGLVPKQPVGSFFTKTEILTNGTIRETFKKYYKYTAVTNFAGDYIIAGLPVGSYTVHMDADLSDIGPFSLTPGSLISQGYSRELFDEGNFKPCEDLENCIQVESQEAGIEIRPLWGDNTFSEIGVSRLDFSLNKKITPTFTFFTSTFSMNKDDYWGDRVINRKYTDWIRYTIPIYVFFFRIGQSFFYPRTFIYGPNYTNYSRLNGGPRNSDGNLDEFLKYPNRYDRTPGDCVASTFVLPYNINSINARYPFGGFNGSCPPIIPIYSIGRDFIDQKGPTGLTVGDRFEWPGFEISLDRFPFLYPVVAGSTLLRPVNHSSTTPIGETSLFEGRRSLGYFASYLTLPNCNCQPRTSVIPGEIVYPTVGSGDEAVGIFEYRYIQVKKNSEVVILPRRRFGDSVRIRRVRDYNRRQFSKFANDRVILPFYLDGDDPVGIITGYEEGYRTSPGLNANPADRFERAADLTNARNYAQLNDDVPYFIKSNAEYVPTSINPNSVKVIVPYRGSDGTSNNGRWLKIKPAMRRTYSQSTESTDGPFFDHIPPDLNPDSDILIDLNFYPYDDPTPVQNQNPNTIAGFDRRLERFACKTGLKVSDFYEYVTVRVPQYNCGLPSGFGRIFSNVGNERGLNSKYNINRHDNPTPVAEVISYDENDNPSLLPPTRYESYYDRGSLVLRLSCNIEPKITNEIGQLVDSTQEGVGVFTKFKGNFKIELEGQVSAPKTQDNSIRPFAIIPCASSPGFVYVNPSSISNVKQSGVPASIAETYYQPYVFEYGKFYSVAQRFGNLQDRITNTYNISNPFNGEPNLFSIGPLGNSFFTGPVREGVEGYQGPTDVPFNDVLIGSSCNYVAGSSTFIDYPASIQITSVDGFIELQNRGLILFNENNRNGDRILPFLYDSFVNFTLYFPHAMINKENLDENDLTERQVIRYSPYLLVRVKDYDSVDNIAGFQPQEFYYNPLQLETRIVEVNKSDIVRIMELTLNDQFLTNNLLKSFTATLTNNDLYLDYREQDVKDLDSTSGLKDRKNIGSSLIIPESDLRPGITKGYTAFNGIDNASTNFFNSNPLFQPRSTHMFMLGIKNTNIIKYMFDKRLL